MTTNRDRQRAAARARLEREMAERAEQSRGRRRRNTIIAAGAGALIVVLAAAWVVIALTGDDKKQAAADPSASATPTKCTWLPLVDPSASASPDPETAKNTKDVGTPPATGEARTGTQTMTLDTSVGTVKIEVDTAHAPCAAESFTYLASKNFFNDSICHRLVVQNIYVLQCGDPSGTGYGGPSYRYAEENLPTGKRPAYGRGVVAMANTGQPASTGSQFFIVYKDIAKLDANYTVIGRVTEGLDLIQKVADAGVIPDPSAPAPDPSTGPSDGKPKTEVRIKSLTMSAPAQ
ncbi:MULTISPECIES: peptidylprolyl isomerase [Dactylosporangium]|uniref:Peptidylprolyl isomerase n=2 Tax=Dactylosporangium TaxID=35753 RepID=A0A9W6NMQ3_9ACTN|nr:MULTISPECIES: peptidylprolyl isomerase [Dactylosporangium]UAB94666.1 peptidylprolyl isomerase [Dactylosporangium vinaceum]UWZ43035.1 peptidylprolyl isomerase [Dactylosporangium matsuzakiense]GLL02486.1 peptidylprolyl isomerase [Dactylosporangium matsuzakiense]